MDKRSGRVVATQSGPATFEFDATNERDLEILNNVLGPMTNGVDLILYFVPDRNAE